MQILSFDHLAQIFRASVASSFGYRMDNPGIRERSFRSSRNWIPSHIMAQIREDLQPHLIEVRTCVTLSERKLDRTVYTLERGVCVIQSEIFLG